MSLASACYYHPSPFGSGPSVWGCDLPGLPQGLILLVYPIAAVAVVLGVLLIVSGRNPLPIGRRIVSPLAARLEGTSQVLASILLLGLASEAFGHLSGANPKESPDWILTLFGPLVCAGLGLVGWLVERRARRRLNATPA